MIALALSLMLIATLNAALMELHQNVRLAVDRTDTVDRSRFVSEFIAEAVRWAGVLPVLQRESSSQYSTASDWKSGVGETDYPQVTEPKPFDFCMNSEAAPSPYWPIIWVTDVDSRGTSDAAPCMNNANLLPQSQLIVIDSLRRCWTDCSARLPAWLVLNPGCDPIFTKFNVEIRYVSSDQIPEDCRSNTAIAVFDRQLLFVRDYAWQKGDGIAALMIKRWLAETPSRWSRAEMLAAGVDTLGAKLITPTTTFAVCNDDIQCADLREPLGLELALSMRGWITTDHYQEAISTSLSGLTTGESNDGIHRLKITRTLLRANIDASSFP